MIFKRKGPIFGKICEIEDFEFHETVGHPDYMSNEMESFVRRTSFANKEWLDYYTQEEINAMKKIAKAMEKCLKSEICYVAYDKYENTMTKKGWEMLRKAINEFLNLPSIQKDIKEMQKYPKWNKEIRRKKYIKEVEKSIENVKEERFKEGFTEKDLEIPTELVYWEKDEK